MSEDKVPLGKVLRFTCKKCGNIIRLKRKGSPDVAAAAAPARGNGDFDAGATRVASLGEISKLKKSSAQETGPIAAPEATRVANLREIQNVKKESQAAAPDTPFIDDPDDQDWYVLVAGKQRGPMTRQTVMGMFEKNEIDKRTYAWRDGMGDWKRLAVIPEFEEFAATAGDAAWRVVKAKENRQAPGETTRNIDARKLQEKIRQSIADDEAEADGLSESTAMMDSETLQRRLAQMKAQEQVAAEELAAADEIAAAATFAEETQPHADAAVLAALTGEPTGESLSRYDAEEGSELDEFMPFDSQTGDFEAPRSEELDPTDFAKAATDVRDVPDFDAPRSVEDEEYLQAPPGEATRVFMATAGIFKRRRRNRIAAIVATIFILVIGGIVAGDVTGLYTLPGMGIVYEATGFEDPNVGRAIERAEEKLAESDISDEERAKLREKLLGLGKTKPEAGGGGTKVAKAEKKVEPTVGIVERENTDEEKKALATSIFADDRKKETKLKLKTPEKVSTPNLPDGLTQEAIVKVIGENQRSMGLCIAESMKKGEKLNGKMEVELTIVATGSVSQVIIATSRFKSTAMGSCTVRTMKRWKFPRFNGEPVPVAFPFVLSAGL